MFHRKNTLNDILNYISQADTDQLNEITQAIVQRYGKLSPDWEVAFLSLPKNDPMQRDQMLRSILELHKNA